MMDIQSVKQRFGIIGNTPMLNRALEIAVQVAPTDISVLVTGESGTGKEIIPQIIHQLSSRKHGPYIAVNCGAIPEGTIDSELFGHEKGSFTGAAGSRKGYFEVADGGTIFLDEVAELPLQTQVRLLRVLETGEFIRVGSSQVIKTNVRVVAATNENMQIAIKKGKFREDLFYRLSTVPIQLPPLKDRKEDIHLLFRKFASDFAEKYRMPAIKLDPDAIEALTNYNWPGNVRQLKNITEHISIVEQNRLLDAHTLLSYLPPVQSNLPQVVNSETKNDFSEREILYKVLFDMKNDLNDLKALVMDMIKNGGNVDLTDEKADLINRIYSDSPSASKLLPAGKPEPSPYIHPKTHVYTDAPQENIEEHVEVEESLSLEDREKELISKALEKHKGKRKYAAQELGISERTLYRKIKEYNLK
ncbi:MAG: sigma-54-dependent Fis family transcriptional regulator [Crocinitomicaceae bacterium]|nr:sigma-54-dependent Fis family transcriptional regulator [Crocinitomicaceae bacterium]